MLPDEAVAILRAKRVTTTVPDGVLAVELLRVWAPYLSDAELGAVARALIVEVDPGPGVTR